MGEYADDLIDAGMMEPYPFGLPHASYTHNKPVEAPRIALTDFDEWYEGVNWSGCSKYEIAAVAWFEAAKRYGEQGNDDTFTWWFDALPDVYHMCFKAKIIAKMAWKKSLTNH